MSTLKRALAMTLCAVVVLAATSVPSNTTSASAASARRATDSFTIATFNVRGASHRAARPWSWRINGALRAIYSHRVALVGLQELERPQYLALRRATVGRWGFVGALSRNGKSLDARNAIAYRTSMFQVVGRSSLTIPYLFGTPVAMPVVTFRSRRTGHRFIVINTHNPADVRGNAARYRYIATARQTALANRLRARGSTVFVTGDMNDRSYYHCAMTRTHRMHSANGGSIGGRCRPAKRSGIDWIFGSRNVAFRRYDKDGGTQRAGYSDHPLVSAAVTVR